MPPLTCTSSSSPPDLFRKLETDEALTVTFLPIALARGKPNIEDSLGLVQVLGRRNGQGRGYVCLLVLAVVDKAQEGQVSITINAENLRI
jgi:hypothetical protein